jgi:hypothetical protein
MRTTAAHMRPPLRIYAQPTRVFLVFLLIEAIGIGNHACH